MRLNEFTQVLPESCRLQIVKDGNTVYTGFLGSLEHCKSEETGITGEETVESFNIHTEIWHRNWKEKGLLAPLEPEQLPDFRFKELDLKIYYKITISEV